MTILHIFSMEQSCFLEAKGNRSDSHTTLEYQTSSTLQWVGSIQTEGKEFDLQLSLIQ